MSLFKKANPYKKGKDTYGQNMNSTDWSRSRNEQFYEGLGPKKSQNHELGSIRANLFFIGIILLIIATFLPIWKVDGFDGHRQAGWKYVKNYFENRDAEKEGAEYYKNARENLKKLKDEDSLKKTK